MKTKAVLISSLIAVFFLIFTIGCEEEEGNLDQTGNLTLSITDAPIDDESITGVYIKINELQYHKQNNSWATFEEFDGPKSFNLLELTDSISELLGNFEMEAGQYNQLRFILDVPSRGQSQPSNPGCYLEYENGNTEPLFVPSGGQSGYKATGAFVVPANGTVELTADFNVRKSVIKAGQRFILKPTIRLIVNNQAGSISGPVTNLPETGDVVIYAYEDGTYSDAEAAEPEEEGTRFPNSINSDKVGESGDFKIWYLAPMTYDLVVTHQIDGEFQEVLKMKEDVEVISEKNTSVQIEL